MWSHCQQSLVCIRKSRLHKLLANRSDHTCQLKQPDFAMNDTYVGGDCYGDDDDEKGDKMIWWTEVMISQ